MRRRITRFATIQPRKRLLPSTLGRDLSGGREALLSPEWDRSHFGLGCESRLPMLSDCGNVRRHCRKSPVDFRSFLPA